MMARSLEDDFRLEVRWREVESRDTWQNAKFSAALLRPAGVTRVLLVTHAWHMRRSVLAFERAGLTVIPAPVRRDRMPSFELGDFLPTAESWEVSYFALHEWVGLAYYKLRR